MKKVYSLIMTLIVFLIAFLMFVGCENKNIINENNKQQEKMEQKDILEEQTTSKSKFDSVSDGDTIIIRNAQEDYNFSELIEEDTKVFYYNGVQEEVKSRYPKISVGDNYFILNRKGISKKINIHRNKIIALNYPYNNFDCVINFTETSFEENCLFNPNNSIEYINNSDKFVKIKTQEPFIVTEKNRDIVLSAEQILDSSFFIDSGDGVWHDNDKKYKKTFKIFNVNTNYVTSSIFNGYNMYFLMGTHMPYKKVFDEVSLAYKNQYATKIVEFSDNGKFTVYFTYQKASSDYYKFVGENIFELIGKNLVAVYD